MDITDHGVYGPACEVEVRPGRRCHVLHIPPPADSASPKMLFFCHGSMATMQQYEHQIVEFSQLGYGIVAWDWLGCGASDKPDSWEAYSCAELFEDVKAVYKKYCIALPTVAVGHSMGTSMVVRLADALPTNTLAGLVLLSGTSVFETNAAAIFRLPVFVLDVLHPVLSGGFRTRALHPNTLASSERHHVRMLGRLDAANGQNPMRVCKAYYRQLEWAAPEQFANVTTPTLVIHGDADKLLPPACGRGLAEAVGGPDSGSLVEYHEVALASHQVMMEQPDEVNALLKDFFLAAFLARL